MAMAYDVILYLFIVIGRIDDIREYKNNNNNEQYSRYCVGIGM